MVVAGGNMRRRGVGEKSMARKKDVKVDGLGAWDKYANKTAAEALPEIYEHAQRASQEARDWYWRSIAPKRNASFGIRMGSFCLLVCGAAFPVLAALCSEAATRLSLTQIGVVALATAGLLQAGDRIFGWSSGWLRYMTTVMAMEARTRKFELDWAAHMIDKTGKPTDDDKRPLFDLARQFINDVTKLQNDETEKWVAEFSSSLALLNDLIKSQRESTEKATEAARATLAARESAVAGRREGSPTKRR
jgi:hypothetical protein